MNGCQEEPAEQDGVLLFTNTLDVGDLMGDWLAYHHRLGVAGVLAMDLGSTDGTAEELNHARWTGFVKVLPTMPVTTDTYALMRAHARRTHPARWAVMIDTDEFLVTPSGTLADLLHEDFTAGAEAVVVPRFHMSTETSKASCPDATGHPVDLDLRWVEQDQGKVMIDLRSSARADFAGHGAVDCDRIAEPQGTEVCLLHFPTRSFSQFAVKVDRAAETLEALGDTVDSDFAWHWRQWVKCRDAGDLAEEYLRQFVDDCDVEHLMASGQYVRDDRLGQQWRSFSLA